MVPEGKPHHCGRSVSGTGYLAKEAKALLIRLRQVRPFAFYMPMTEAAAPPLRTLRAIDNMLLAGRRKMHWRLSTFIQQGQRNHRFSIVNQRVAFTLLKLRFNALLDQLDIFSDVLTQRSEHHTGVALGGLDIFARDALLPRSGLYKPPPLVCYLDRGHGAAIRRVRTRLPGGSANPVAIIRVPRERMISSGIASSLVHEVGHQGAALLRLVYSVRWAIRKSTHYHKPAWRMFEKWVSEVLADCWSVATLGIASTAGLMSVVSLPSYFVFRIGQNDPHPFPWIRVMLSATIGKHIYPDPQWDLLMENWQSLYPLSVAKKEQRAIVQMLLKELPAFAEFLMQHRSNSLHGKRFREIFPIEERQPSKLRKMFEDWQLTPKAIYRSRPSVVFAVIGQAKADNRIEPEKENHLLSRYLDHLALTSRLLE